LKQSQIETYSSIVIPTPEEFRFTENWSFLSRSSNECMFHIQEGCVRKALTYEQETSVVEVSEGQDQGIVIHFLGEASPSERMRCYAEEYVRDWFDLDTNLAPFYQLAGTDALLHKVVPRFYGLRVVGIPDLFEAVCWGIIGQQINLTYAYTLKRRFVEAFGKPIAYGDEHYWLFPTPETIASLTVQDLSSMRMTTRKSEYLIHVAALIAEGNLTKHSLLQAGSCRQAEQQLTAIRGIGPWTANYVLMRCLRFKDAFPIDDVGLHNAIKLLLELDSKPPKADINRLAANWHEWEAYATFYLWRTIY